VIQYLQKHFLQPLQKTTSFGRFSHIEQQLNFKICLKTFFLSAILESFSSSGYISNFRLALLEKPTETFASSPSDSVTLDKRF